MGCDSPAGRLVRLVGHNELAGARQAFEAEPNELSREAGLAMVRYAEGDAAGSDALLAALEAKYGAKQGYPIASVYAWRGQDDQAFAWLEKARQASDPNLSSALIEPLFARLHDDPRWLPFLRSIGLAPEQLAKIQMKVTLPP